MNRVPSLPPVIFAGALALAAWAALLAGPIAPMVSADSISPIDGAYAKIEREILPQWWMCRRCADYRPAGGIWRLWLRQGDMQIEYEATGWRSVAAYQIENDQLVLKNDVYCPDTTGRYRWAFQSGQLRLSAIDDACAFGLRAETLTRIVWDQCVAANGSEPAGAGPEGCTAPQPPAGEPGGLIVPVNVLGGDSRFFSRQPDLYIPANVPESTAAADVRLSAHPDSVSYGLNRVLWWGGDWIEFSAEQPYVAWGVQFHGDPAIGWARVLLDGFEVWRGDTAAIWSFHGRHAAYIELVGVPPGPHTLRVESLGFDYRGVTVAGFGLSGEASEP